jgi:hypothetical protein
LALGFLATTARSDEITLSLPAGLAAPLADALRHLREAATRERAAAFDELARRLVAGAPLELTAPRDALRELLAVAIDEAGERVSRDSSRLLRGDPVAADLRAALEELGALLDLLETVSR